MFSQPAGLETFLKNKVLDVKLCIQHQFFFSSKVHCEFVTAQKGRAYHADGAKIFYLEVLHTNPGI